MSPGTQRIQSESDLLELELQARASGQTWVLGTQLGSSKWRIDIRAGKTMHIRNKLWLEWPSKEGRKPSAHVSMRKCREWLERWPMGGSTCSVSRRTSSPNPQHPGTLLSHTRL